MSTILVTGGTGYIGAHAVLAESVTDPAKYYRNNVTGTLTLLEAMDKDIKSLQ